MKTVLYCLGLWVTVAVISATAAPLTPINAEPAASDSARAAAQRADALAVVRAARARCAHQPPAARSTCMQAAQPTLNQAELYSTQQ